jgi:hypothetical protein
MVNNMKVYLVYGLDSDDYCEEPFVQKVFDTERKAIDYVIKQYYSGPEYCKLGQTMLDDNASNHVEEMELE